MAKVSSCDLIYDLDVQTQGSLKIALGCFYCIDDALIVVIGKTPEVDLLDEVGILARPICANPFGYLVQAVANLLKDSNKNYFDRFVKSHSGMSSLYVINTAKDIETSMEQFESEQLRITNIAAHASFMTILPVPIK